MNRLPIFIILTALAAFVATSCNKDDDSDWYSKYEEWRISNDAWIKEQQARTNPDGTPYFQTVVPTWNPNAYVLIHYFNDRALTAGNLQPLSTSTVDTRYIGHYYNNEPFDSSYNMTANGPGIFRTKLNGVIEGWTIALETMHVGDTVEVIIPYQSAYGTSVSATMPPYSNLRFNMRLVDIYKYETNPK